MRRACYLGNRRVELQHVPPVPPAAGEAQIAVAWCGICGTDIGLVQGEMDSRVTLPHVFGHEMSGTIAAVGPEVSGFCPGDRVTVRPVLHSTPESAYPGQGTHIRPGMKFMGVDLPGAMQETWNVPSGTLHRIPSGMDLETAALIEPLAVACHDVRRAELRQGEHVVVLGGGPIGALIALVSRHSGGNVIVSEPSQFRRDLLESLGISTADPLAVDLPQFVREQTTGLGADVVFEVSGQPAAAQVMTALPRVRGRIVAVGIFAHPVPVDLKAFFLRELELRGARIYDAEDYETAIALAANGKLPLKQLVTARLDLDGLADGLPDTRSQMKVLVRCGAVEATSNP